MDDFFDALPVGDIAGDLRGPDHVALRITDRRDGKRDDNVRAVDAPANGLEMFDVLLASDPAKYLAGFVNALGRHEDRDGLSDDVFSLVAEHLRRAGVPTRDVPH